LPVTCDGAGVLLWEICSFGEAAVSASIEFSTFPPPAAASVVGSFELSAPSLVAGTLSSGAAGAASSPAESLAAACSARGGRKLSGSR
jgi:hypothetical protein